ncbi:hypothetical protein GCM10025858_27350 [Alicyclobacillus sacchari]|nr:hypothetical protein [Alicyclobacillus sacchari]GMA58232.1 hypothetical protein GCM10025858_27350 [Alicyclobacillus sacchari]
MYYVGADISSANITVKTHDDFGEARLGLQGLEVFDKYVVDVLGGAHPVHKEKRMPFRVRRKEK